MEIITGYVGKPHVTSEQDRDVHIGMIGSGSYVLQTGKQMTAEISSNNEIKVRDGVLMHQGCAASIKKNTYDSLSIVNGSQGMRKDSPMISGIADGETYVASDVPALLKYTTQGY